MKINATTFLIRSSGWLLGIAAVLWSAPRAAAQVTFQEGDFAPGSFALSFVEGGAGGSAAITLIGTGNPGAALSFAHSIPGGPPTGGFCANWVWTFVVLAEIDPSTLGGIGSIDFAIDSARISTNPELLGQSQTALLVQNGKRYISLRPPGTAPNTPNWVTTSMAGLVATEFAKVINAPPCDFVNPTSHPDFSAAAPPIQLGFARGNSSDLGGSPGPLFINYGADNWTMTITPGPGGACDADCDESGTLSIDDFICFQTLFALGDPGADCDESGSLSIDDFICFQTLFAIGC